MFDSLALEDPRSTRRRWATFTSFTIETILLGLMIAAPLVFTEQIQLVKLGEILIAPAGAPDTPAAPAPPQPTHPAVTTEFVQGHLVYGGKVPDKVNKVVDSDGFPSVDPAFLVPGGTGKGTNSLLQNLLKPAVTPPVETHTAPTTPRISISHLDPGFLISRVQPTYPKIAVTAGIQGTVVLAAVIDTSGRITQLRSISGHPFLTPAAIDAVRQWRYKPYILNGSPVEVETQVSVIFTLNR